MQVRAYVLSSHPAFVVRCFGTIQLCPLYNFFFVLFYWIPLFLRSFKRQLFFEIAVHRYKCMFKVTVQFVARIRFTMYQILCLILLYTSNMLRSNSLCSTLQQQLSSERLCWSSSKAVHGPVGHGLLEMDGLWYPHLTDAWAPFHIPRSYGQ